MSNKLITEQQLMDILYTILQLDKERHPLQHNSPLLGAYAELDSMAIMGIISGIEEQFQIIVEDDELSAELFETVGSLLDFIRSKQN